jgi:hypothetical protein
MNKNCVCLICHKPTDIWVDFLSKFTNYDVYIIIDDNSKDYKSQYSEFHNINIIQIKDEECKKNGFVDMNFTIKKDITAWEKSIYYFSTINTEYNKVWFFEDDVFFYDEKSLLNIDSNYENSDLLSNSYTENISGHKKDWHWHRIHIKFPPPYYGAMVCCVRMSSDLLSKIRNYANEHNTLFFLEALFPTICKRNNMKYDTPTKLKNIIYRKTYKDKDIDANNIYHPVKDIKKHKYYRDMLNTK